VQRGELVKVAYRLGRHAASGVLTIDALGARVETIVLRRGAMVIVDGELARRVAVARLARLAALDGATISFTGGVAAYPPGARAQLPLARWARRHLEAQLDGAFADALARELAGARLAVREDLAPEPEDDADRRMLAAMARPRRLEQIWPLARTPKFRLLAFLWFLRGVGALDAEGVVAERSGPIRAACRVLGVDDATDPDAIKRAYRRLARELHPDLHPHADPDARRALERRFAAVSEAYEALERSRRSDDPAVVVEHAAR
jgi:DnaJ-domain-containing protein 1